MRLVSKIIFLLFTASLLFACSEEEYVYPDVITEIVCLKTDAQGSGYQLITDHGKTMDIPVGQRPSNKLTPDSIYRVFSKYVPKGNEADVYVLQSVNASLPVSETEFESIHTDAVTIQSIWRSGDYLNMILEVMVKDQKHQFAFIDNGITTHEGGQQTLSITLFHNRNNDIEGFYRKAYLSIPLWYYKNLLNKGDIIQLHLNTYKEGMTSRTYTY